MLRDKLHDFVARITAPLTIAFGQFWIGTVNVVKTDI